MDPEHIEVERRPFRGDLLEALVVDVMGKEQRACPLGDRRRLVVGGVADAAAEASGLVAVGVVGEGGVDQPAADARHRMGKSRARERIRIGADIGLRQQIAIASYAKVFTGAMFWLTVAEARRLSTLIALKGLVSSERGRKVITSPR